MQHEAQFFIAKDMNMQDSPALLPSGFMDVLPPEAQNEAEAISSLMGLYTAFGYERIKPPLVEFEETMLGDGPGAALAGDTFRMMDPVSHRMLALRADSTPQISRIAKTRLAETGRPLRLTYATDVLRTRASQDRLARQFTQVGCEIIGGQDAKDQIEIAVMAVWGLSKIGVKEITIDLALPRLADHLMRKFKIYNDSRREEITEAVRKRDKDYFGAGKEKLDKLMVSLLDLNDGADETIKKLEKIGDQDIRVLCRDLKEIYNGLQTAFAALGLEHVNISLDIFEHKGFDYHKGVAFTLFADHVRGELGRGGLYNLSGDDDAPKMASGFTLYMDTVRTAYHPQNDAKVIAVAEEQSWGDLKSLQEQGWKIWRGEVKKAPAYCSHKFENGKVKEI